MQNIGYYNGEVAPLEELKIPALDRAVYFGDGCYEALYLVNGVLFALEEHLDRFYNSCRLLKIQFPLNREELKAELQKVVDVAGAEYAGMLYWQASRGTYWRGHAFPPAEVKPNLLIFARPCPLDPFHTLRTWTSCKKHTNINLWWKLNKSKKRMSTLKIGVTAPCKADTIPTSMWIESI